LSQTTGTNPLAQFRLSDRSDPHKPVNKAGQQASAEKKKINKPLNESCRRQGEYGCAG